MCSSPFLNPSQQYVLFFWWAYLDSAQGVCLGHGWQVVCVMVQLTPHDQKSLCQAHTLSLHSLLLSRQICARSPLHSQLPRGPGTSLPFSGRRTQVSGVSRTGHVFLGLGHMSWCPLVSLGFAILQRSWESSQTLSQPPQLAFIAGQRHPAFCVLGQGKSSHPILPSGPVRSENSPGPVPGPRGMGRLIYPPLPPAPRTASLALQTSALI